MTGPAGHEGWLRRAWDKLAGLFAQRVKFPPPPDPDLVGRVKGWFAEQLSCHPHLPIERRGEYARAAGVVFERMTPTALMRVVQNVQEIRFYATLEEMTVELAREHRTVAQRLARGLAIGGAYLHAVRQLHLNGGGDEMDNRAIVRLYGHEFSHALNGPDRRITNSAAWQRAWGIEMRRHPLSQLALVNPHEGFAEIGKFLYSGAVSRKALAKRYPRCVEVWKGHGLW
jgi:hypothetical protein